MKKLYRFSAIALLVLPLIFTSCSDYLDRDDDDNITEADVFARYEKVNGLVSDVYAAAKKADRPLVFFEHFSNSAITDECEGTNVEGNITNNFNNGAWNPNSLPGSVGQYWEALYEGIRKANLIIENVQKYNTPDNPQQDGDLRNRIGEMYFMRGYFHMLLLRMYGEAPYIDRVINAGDNMDFKKESVHSMVEKIVTDAQTAYGMVPNKYVKTSENFGRVDKGACLRRHSSSILDALVVIKVNISVDQIICFPECIWFVPIDTFCFQICFPFRNPLWSYVSWVYP